MSIDWNKPDLDILFKVSPEGDVKK